MFDFFREMPRTSILQDDCHERCSRYSYWWTYKASLMPRERFVLGKCVQKCMRDEFKRQKTKNKTNTEIMNIN